MSVKSELWNKFLKGEELLTESSHTYPKTYEMSEIEETCENCDLASDCKFIEKFKNAVQLKEKLGLSIDCFYHSNRVNSILFNAIPNFSTPRYYDAETDTYSSFRFDKERSVNEQRR